MLKTSNLCIGYKKGKQQFTVQQELNLELLNGELVCLLGLNGCGKSTLIRSLAGLQPALSGNIFVQGNNIASQTPVQRAQLISVVLTDRIDMGTNITVTDMVSLGRHPHTDWFGKPSENDKLIIENAINSVNLGNKKHHQFNELSDGERQRTIIAKALAQDTPVVILDEPTAHLDLPHKVEIMLLLRQLARQTQKAILLSTHEPELALQVAHRIWLMSEQGIEQGIPEDIINKGILQQAFKSDLFFFDTEKGNVRIN